MFHDLFISLAQNMFAMAQKMQMLGFLSALLIVVFRFEKYNFLARLVSIAALFGIVPGLFFWGARQLAIQELSPLSADYFFPPDAWNTWAISVACGFVLVVAWLRLGVQFRDLSWEKLTRKSLTERNRKTDVREIHKFLPKESLIKS